MIFEDPSHRRWRRALIVFALLAVAALGALGITVAGVMVRPRLPNPFSSKSAAQATLVKASLEHDKRPVYTPQQKKRMQAIRAQEKSRRDKLIGAGQGKAIPRPIPLPPKAVVGFIAQDDPSSVASLEHHVGDIEVVVPDWFELPGPGCELIERIDDKTRRVLSRSDVIVLPRLANLVNDEWRGKEVSAFLENDPVRACLVKRLVDRLLAVGAEGVNIDLEELTPKDTEPFLEFLVELRAALHPRNLRLTVDVPFRDPAFDYEYIGDVSDAVMVMAYDEHYSESKPGPIASRDWLSASLDDMLPRLPPDRVVIALGSYGYDWPLGEPQKKAEDVSFRGVMDLARAAGASPVFEEDLENGHFGYRDHEGAEHEVWFQDALSTWNQVRTLSARGVSRIGLWRLGTEDETLWSFLGDDTPPATPTVLSDVSPAKSVAFVGEGEIYSIRGEPQAGARAFDFGPDGRILRGHYDRVPSGYVVEKRGSRAREVALTFDDGPDERSTEKILDVLHDLKVPATFFVVGDQATRFPEIVVREADEGHLVANHTFSHPHLETLTPREAAAELGATERLIEGLTGLRTPLFRAPYNVDVDPESADDLAALRLALQGGYLFVGADVDPNDWDDTKSVAQLSNTVVAKVTGAQGRIVVFHDGGGDRTRTVETVRRVVPALRALGYEFVSIDKLLGVKRDELVTKPPPGERLLSAGDAARAYARGWGWTAMGVLFFVCTLLSIVRILFLGGLTLADLRRPRPVVPAGFSPLVTVLVPAYNEAKVIANTLFSLLASDYQNLEILVIDDGSTDETSEVVAALAAENPKIRLITQKNGGKSAAANHGLEEAHGEIIVAVDADTLVTPEAIPKMVGHFASEGVTAVCGNIEVGNVNGVVTAFQAIEYVTSQNFDRRAFSALNCISVVPGALGAWRREAVITAGGYSDQTLTEDADLTLTILRRGGRVVYEPEAYGRTEAPETLSALLKQRFRWTYGTYQCLWKHRRAFFKGTLGWIGLPNMIIFQIVFPLLSPIGDLMMVLSVFRGDWRAFMAGYLAFLAMDVCGSLLAFTLDRKPLRWLPLLLIQRFSYRQIMYYVCFKAMIAAVRGARHGWRKLDRTGSVAVGAGRSSRPPPSASVPPPAPELPVDSLPPDLTGSSR